MLTSAGFSCPYWRPTWRRRFRSWRWLCRRSMSSEVGSLPLRTHTSWCHWCRLRRVAFVCLCRKSSWKQRWRERRGGAEVPAVPGQRQRPVRALSGNIWLWLGANGGGEIAEGERSQQFLCWFSTNGYVGSADKIQPTNLPTLHASLYSLTTTFYF